jgi:hypothetical protein
MISGDMAEIFDMTHAFVRKEVKRPFEDGGLKFKF